MYHVGGIALAFAVYRLSSLNLYVLQAAIRVHHDNLLVHTFLSCCVLTDQTPLCERLYCILL